LFILPWRSALSFDAMLYCPLGDCNKLALIGLDGDCGDLYEDLPGDPSPLL